MVCAVHFLTTEPSEVTIKSEDEIWRNEMRRSVDDACIVLGPPPKHLKLNMSPVYLVT